RRERSIHHRRCPPVRGSLVPEGERVSGSCCRGGGVETMGFKYAVRSDDIGWGMHVGWMDAYVYAADIYCEDCGRAIKKGLEKSDDSDDYPQGPYPDGSGESDGPQHCGAHAGCLNAMEFAGTKVGVWLGNPLTNNG